MLTVNVNLAMMEPAVRTVSHTTHITYSCNTTTVLVYSEFLL